MPGDAATGRRLDCGHWTALRRAASLLRRDDSGQGLTEYAVIIAVVAGVVAVALTFMAGKMDGVLRFLLSIL